MKYSKSNKGDEKKMNNRAQISAELLVILAAVIAAAVVVVTSYSSSIKKIDTKYDSNINKANKLLTIK